MWFIIALVLGAGLAALVLWLRSRDTKVAWYVWLMGIIGLLLVLLAIQHYTGSLVELYPQAGWLGALIIGVPGLILIVLAWQLIARRQHT